MQKAPQKRKRGRPPTGKLQMTIKLSPQARDLIKERARQLGLNYSEYVERVILAAEKS